MLRSLCLVLALSLVAITYSPVQAADAALGHMVFFKLKESTPENAKKLVDACNKLLTKHEGTVYYSAGIRGAEFNRDVNDQDYDVALHLVFANKAAHDTYQDHPRHVQFVNENKATWAKVRVFDSYITPAAK